MSKFEPQFTNRITIGDLIEALKRLPPETPVIPYEGGTMPLRYPTWDRVVYGGGNLFLYSRTLPDYDLLGDKLLNYLNATDQPGTTASQERTKG